MHKSHIQIKQLKRKEKEYKNIILIHRRLESNREVTQKYQSHIEGQREHKNFRLIHRSIKLI